MSFKISIIKSAKKWKMKQKTRSWNISFMCLNAKIYIKRTKKMSEHFKMVKNVYLCKLCVSFPQWEHQRKKTINFIIRNVPSCSIFLFWNKKKMLSRFGHYHRVIKSWSKIRVCGCLFYVSGFILTTHVTNTIIDKWNLKENYFW